MESPGTLLDCLPSAPFPDAALIGLDIETTGLDYDAVVTAHSLSDGCESHVTDLRGMSAVTVGSWLDRLVTGRTIAVHNGQFDLPRLVNAFGCGYPDSVWDTQVAEQLLTAGLDVEEDDETGEERPISRSLQATARRRLGLYIDKDQDIRTGFQLDTEWSDEMVRYAARDAEVLIRLAEEQQEAIAREGMQAIAAIEMAAVPVFAEMWRRGVAVDADRLTVLMDEARSKAAVAESSLQEVLTPLLYWPRMRAQEEEDKKLQEWQDRLAAAESDYRSDWRFRVEIEGLPRAQWQARWEGVTIEGSAKPITAAEIDSWLDTAPKSKTDPTPRGQARYVRRMLQYWRQQPGNERPGHRTVTISEPINVRSHPQKADAIGEWLRAYNRKHRAMVEPPENFRRKTLVAYSATCPEEMRTAVIEPLLEFTKHDKLVSSFGDKLLETLRNGTLHGGWRQVGTATGRPTCSRPNLLQMPKLGAFRRCFRARKAWVDALMRLKGVEPVDHVFIVADYSQMELRLLAEYSQDPAMLAAFLEDKDIHTETASAVFSVAPESVTKEQRDVAKVVNFGTSYGMAKYALQYNLAGQRIFVSLDQSEAFLQGWRRKFAKAWGWIESQGHQALRRGWTATPLGRRRYFVRPSEDIPDSERRQREGKIKREGANHPIQGGNADITKLAMVLIQDELRPLGGSVVMQIYDELVCEVPEAHAQAAKHLVETAMVTAAEAVLKTVPVKVDCVISPSWDEKEASQ